MPSTATASAASKAALSPAGTAVPSHFRRSWIPCTTRLTRPAFTHLSMPMMPSLGWGMSPFHSMASMMSPPFFRPSYIPRSFPSLMARSFIPSHSHTNTTHRPCSALVSPLDFPSMCGPFPHFSMPSLSVSLPESDNPEVQNFYDSVLAANKEGKTTGISVQQSTINGQSSTIVSETAADRSLWSEGDALSFDSRKFSLKQKIDGAVRVTRIEEKPGAAENVADPGTIPDDERIKELTDEEAAQAGEQSDASSNGEELKA